MKDGSRSDDICPISEGAGPVTDLAANALSILARRRHEHRTAFDEGTLAILSQTVLANQPPDNAHLLARLMGTRLGPDDIAATYIPEVARRLGAGWVADDLTFVEVSIATARLQALLRDIGGAWSGDLEVPSDAPLLAVIVPTNEDHTLGPMILTGQLRQLGYCVRVLIGRSEPDLIDVLRRCDFDAVLISVSNDKRLVSVRNFVRKLRDGRAATPRICIGGPAVGENRREARAFTGADHAARTAEEAMDLCGLTRHHHGAGPSDRRTGPGPASEAGK